MTDENNGRIMLVFVGLKSKMYAIKLFYSLEEREVERLKLLQCNDDDFDMDVDNVLQNLGVIKKDKGITGATLRKISFEEYYMSF